MAPIEDKTFRGYELIIMRNTIINILTTDSVNMIINYQVDSDKNQRPIQPDLINKHNFSWKFTYTFTKLYNNWTENTHYFYIIYL